MSLVGGETVKRRRQEESEPLGGRFVRRYREASVDRDGQDCSSYDDSMAKDAENVVLLILSLRKGRQDVERRMDWIGLDWAPQVPIYLPYH